jgi:hypothetical protein
VLLTNETLQAAIEVFLREAHIPRPRNWTPDWDKQFVNRHIVPAFYKALQEIEEVWPCVGFDLKKIHPNQGPPERQ